MPDPPNLQIKSVKEFSLAGEHYRPARVPDTDQLFVGGQTAKLQLVDLAAEKPTPIAWDAHVSHISGLVLTSKYLVSAGSELSDDLVGPRDARRPTSQMGSPSLALAGRAGG